jgi:V/A-type H+-transporting ATPase subunit A
MKLRGRYHAILHDESELNEMVQLVGMDALSAQDRLKMETARSIREDYLHQNAFHETDTYSSLHKQTCMMDLILDFYEDGKKVLESGASIEKIVSLPVREQIGRFKYVPEEQADAEHDKIDAELNAEVEKVIAEKEDF